MSQFHTLTIKNINKETDSCVTVSFEIPPALKGAFTFKAGQYITLKTDINEKEIRRDYSLCNSPSSDEFKVAIKEVEGGTFSKYANTVLKIGDVLEVAIPNGRFVFEPNNLSSRTIAAFAAGSGITPIMSIAKTILENEPQSNFILVYGNKTPKDTIFYNEIQALQTKYQNRFDVQFVFSQTDEDIALFGRIEKSTVNYIVKNKYKDTTIDAFYLCGPEEMITTVSDVLKENNVNETKIYFELFTVSKPLETETKYTANGNTKITVVVDDEETAFTMSQNKTILEAALENEIDAPYSCQGGICSSCIARITEGKATMRQNNILTESELAEGLILTCQAQPTTPTIVIDYDDV